MLLLVTLMVCLGDCLVGLIRRQISGSSRAPGTTSFASIHDTTTPTQHVLHKVSPLWRHPPTACCRPAILNERVPPHCRLCALDTDHTGCRSRTRGTQDGAIHLSRGHCARRSQLCKGQQGPCRSQGRGIPRVAVEVPGRDEAVVGRRRGPRR